MIKNFNKVASGIFLVVSAIAIVTVISCSKKSAGQTFTGTGAGRNGKIEVSATINNGKIVDAKVV